MRQFCEEVLKFLRAEYNDSYKFDIILYKSYGALCNDEAELTITVNQDYKIKLKNNSVQFLLGSYYAQEFIEERGLYRWQKELIDIIEGS